MQTQTLILLLVLTISSFTIKALPTDDDDYPGIAIYWGQSQRDGSLSSTCDTGYFKIVLLAFLNVFGSGRTPSLNFDGHCGAGYPCFLLGNDIKYCQKKGVKVLLSIGGAGGNYSLNSPNDAKVVGDYLYDNFLSGHLGPLGEVTLDGIDFHIEGGSNLYWDDLARHLDNLRPHNYQYGYFDLSASPQCVIPDYYLHKAIKTGLFDYVLVKFYNNRQCQFDTTKSDATLLLKSWNQWTSLVLPNNSVFLGLPAAPNAAPSGGYIPTDDLQKVLPVIYRTSSNYGGVMLWDRSHDNGNNNYSNEIWKYILNQSRQFVTQVSEAIARMNAVFPN